MRKLAAILALVREQMSDELSSDLQEVVMEDGQLLGAISKAVRKLSDFSPYHKNEEFTIYAAPDDDYIVDAEDVSAWSNGSTATVAVATLTPARNITITLTDADNSVTAFTLTVVGKDARGTAQTEVFYWNGGKKQTGTLLFSSITSVTGTEFTGAGTGDVLDIGFGPWVHKGFSLNATGSDRMVNLSYCRDDYAMPYFKNLVTVYKAEYPSNDNDPPSWRNVELLGDELWLAYDGEVTSSEEIRIVWGAIHELTYEKSTIPAHMEELLVDGAMGYAYRIMANSKINAVNIGASAAPQLKETGYTKIQEFEEGLRNSIPVEVTEEYSRE